VSSYITIHKFKNKGQNQGTIFLIKGIFCIIITIIRETTNNKTVTRGTDIIGLIKDGDNKNTPNNP
jgi:hypothetical protein